MNKTIEQLNTIESNIISGGIDIRELLAEVLKTFDNTEDTDINKNDKLNIDKIVNNLLNIRESMHECINNIYNEDTENPNKKIHSELLITKKTYENLCSNIDNNNIFISTRNIENN